MLPLASKTTRERFYLAMQMLRLLGVQKKVCTQVIRGATRPNGSINVALLERAALETALPLLVEWMERRSTREG